MSKKNRYSDRGRENTEEIKEIESVEEKETNVEEVTIEDAVTPIVGMEVTEEVIEVSSAPEVDTIKEEVTNEESDITTPEEVKPENIEEEESKPVETEEEKETEEVEEKVEVKAGSTYIEISGLITEGKKAITKERVRSIGLTKIVDNGKSIIVGPFESKEQAINIRRGMLRKGLKGNIVEK